MTDIVVGVDGSPTGDLALQWAVRESALRHTPLTALLAWGYLDQHYPDADREFDTEYADGDARIALDAYLERALDPDVAAGVERRTACALAPAALLDAATNASLLVVGARGNGALKGLVLGSVSRHCLNHATCPLAVVRAGPRLRAAASTERIVVGIDGSEGSRAALLWAVDEALARHATLDALLTWHLPYVGGYPYSGPSFDPGALEDDARTTLQGLVASTDNAGLVAPVNEVVLLGDAAAALVDASSGADLLVVGARGLGGFAGLLLGSVSHHVANHATCPVVVIPPPA